MLLKRLELQGFKSFADKTTLDFNHKVTAIVGPNGSGKSNVTDSVRWLLGERDARNLRGGKGEDLIFAGTKDKARSGQAQATLHLDNTSGFFPVDFKDLNISRKVTRDGTSSFTINKSEVRLKDIIEFFARAKIGARGLTVINQGESDVFIKASPAERREMIEEILGLKEYQIKKADAARKLKNTSFNLEKAKALIEELKPHLRLLRRQVNRYEGREKAEEELTSLEDRFYGTQIETLEREIGTIKEGEKKVDAELSVETKKLEELRRALVRVKEEEPQSAKDLDNLRKEGDEMQKQRAQLQIELGRVEARLEIAASRKGFDEIRAKEVIDEVRSISKGLLSKGDATALKSGIERILSLVNSLEASEGSGEDFSKEKEKLVKSLSEMDKNTESLKKREDELRKGLESFNEEFTKSYEKLDQQQKRVGTTTDKRNDLVIKRERLEARLDSLLDEIKQIGRSRSSLKAKGGSSGDPDDVRQRMLKLRSQLAAIGEIDEGVLKEAKETEERHTFLSSQVEDLEKAASDLKNLIKELEEKIHDEFGGAMDKINEEFNKLVHIVFGGGKASLKLERQQKKKSTPKDMEDGVGSSDDEIDDEELKPPGVLVDIVLPKKKIKGLEVLSGGERALVSIAALFSLISVSSPPFLFLDEVDAALDERNAKRFGDIVKEFSKKTQFVIVTHNRATMEAADALYGVTMGKDGTSKLVSLKLT